MHNAELKIIIPDKGGEMEVSILYDIFRVFVFFVLIIIYSEYRLG